MKQSKSKLPAKAIVFADTDVVGVGELASALKVSRWMVQKWFKAGYQFEFPLAGKTTPGHCKQWLRENPTKRYPRQEVVA